MRIDFLRLLKFPVFAAVLATARLLLDNFRNFDRRSTSATGLQKRTS
jgi:hypothetical protein